MSEQDENTLCVTKNGKLFIINIVDEGIIIDVYTEDGDTFLGSPFAATWEEMIEGDNDAK